MKSFWMGHRMLGDVIGFCAAAHLYSAKIGRPVKVWFDPTRIDACHYFDGVIWTPLERLPGAIDCGGTPTPDEWPQMNGVKRFYRYMDPTLTPPKSFDVHFNRPRRAANGAARDNLIGLITHSNTQGDIDDETLDAMLAEARRHYPHHRIASFGCRDNARLPPGVEDQRAAAGDIRQIIEFVERLDLLIAPHAGPCFIAAGWKVPTWVHRSREPHWDYALHYDTYQVSRWWARKPPDPFDIFERIYQSGGWNGVGSGPGSLPQANQQYIALLQHLIQGTPGIRSILDIGCGDWQIMRHVDLRGKRYLGVDVAPSVIEANRQSFAREGIEFRVLNACREEFPAADLILLKDVLPHLPIAQVQTLLSRIAGRCRWALLVNDHTEQNGAQDIRLGEWRPINVLRPPYDFPGATLAIWNGKHIALGAFPQ